MDGLPAMAGRSNSMCSLMRIDGIGSYLLHLTRLIARSS